MFHRCSFAWTPTIDKYEWDDTPAAMAAKGKNVKNVTVLLGNVKNEGKFDALWTLSALFNVRCTRDTVYIGFAAPEESTRRARDRRTACHRYIPTDLLIVVFSCAGSNAAVWSLLGHGIKPGEVPYTFPAHSLISRLCSTGHRGL